MARELAFFNLEWTIADMIARKAMSDLAISGLIDSRELPKRNDSSSIQMAFLHDWLVGKKESDIEPLLDLTVKETDFRLARWARRVIHAQAEMGREIGLYSAMTPIPILDAYAEGIEATVPGAKVKHVYGRDMIMSGDRFTGEYQKLHKRYSVVRALGETGSLMFAADSFANGEDVLRMAQTPVIVNSWNVPGFNRVDWRYTDEPVVGYRTDATGTHEHFDLNDANQADAFLATVFAQDPAYNP